MQITHANAYGCYKTWPFLGSAINRCELPMYHSVILIKNNNSNLHQSPSILKMAPLSVMLLINHDDASIPGQWAIFIATDRRQSGTLFRAVEKRSEGINRELRKGFVINPQETVSVVTLGAIVDLDLCLLEEIAAGIVMPWAKGALSKV